MPTLDLYAKQLGIEITRASLGSSRGESVEVRDGIDVVRASAKTAD